MPVFPYPVFRVAGLPVQLLQGILVEQIPVSQTPLHDPIPVSAAFAQALTILPESPLRTAVYNAARDFRKRQKLPGAAFDALLAQADSQPAIAALQAAIATSTQQQAAIRNHRQQLHKWYETQLTGSYEQVQKLAQLPDFQRALCFSSHDLLRRIPHFIGQPVTEFGKQERHIALGLVQYMTRMAFKTTPLSRFAGVGILPDAEPDESDPFGAMDTPAKITPNVALLEALYAVLLQEPVFYQALHLRLNPSIVRIELIEYQWLFFTGEEESIQQSAANPLLDSLIAQLIDHQHQLPYKDIASGLLAQVDATPADIEAYLFQLIEIGLLEWVYPEPGLSPSWAGRLYQFLGFLPGGSSVAAITDITFLLQWLRTAARTIPFQAPDEACATIAEAYQTASEILTRHNGVMPSFPPEQLFYEDAGTTVTGPSYSILAELATELGDYWRQLPPQPLTGLRAELQAAVEIFGNQHDSVFTFLKTFFNNRNLLQNATLRNSQSAPLPAPLGMLLLPYCDTDGQWHAVVQGIFPGGGKLMARWLHILPEKVREALIPWANQPAGGLQQVAFGWQGWFNANFQPPIMHRVLGLPDGRATAVPSAIQQSVYRLGALQIRQTPDGRAGLHHGEERLIINDLGLENFNARPPALKILTLAGLPRIATDMLPKSSPEPIGAGCLYLPRIRHKHLIIRRARWEVPALIWRAWLPKQSDTAQQGFDFWLNIQQVQRDLDLPQWAFVRVAGQKSQFFDLHSPILVKVLEKILRRQTTDDLLIFEEMLPMPKEGGAMEVAMEVGFGID